MTDFKECVKQDIKTAFLDIKVFGEAHNLNGTSCICILQDVTAQEQLSNGYNTLRNDGFPGLYAVNKQLNVAKDDLPEVPVYGQVFTIDGDEYQISAVDDDEGILTINLVANAS